MKKTISFLVVVFVLAAGQAMAFDMEFYTYGGFNPVVQAFNKVALMFSDNAYKGLFFVVTVLGVLAAALGMIAKATVGGRYSLTWPVPVLVGAALYLALFVPTGNITVYDPTLNRFQIVPNVPDAIVFTAGTLNKVEKGLVDIIDTASAPNASYIDKAGGIGFKALEAIRGSNPKDNNARVSMIRYIKDCVTFELMRPGSTMSLDILRNTSINFLIELANAQNPAIYTVYYDSSHPEGTSMTCTDAWNNLQPIYASTTNYSEAKKRACAKAHFDPNNVTEMSTCENLISSSLLYLTGTSQTAERLIQQRQIAEILYNFYYTDDYETSVLVDSDRKITASGIGVGITMNEWIPIIRAIMTAIAIGTLPFLALFLPTPIFGRALSVMFGFFVFLTTWGVTDAVIHGAAMDYASYAFEDVRQSNLGVYAMFAFPNMSVKMMAMFGLIRSAGIMLASVFSVMLVKFGGSALAHFATNLGSVVRGAGAEAGRLLTPEGNAAAMAEQTRIAGLLEGMQEHRFTNMAAAGAYSMHKSVGEYQAAMNARNVLQSTGQIPTGTTAAEFAQMGAAARMVVGGKSGPVEISTGPGGDASVMKFNFAAGTAMYGVGSDGNYGLTSANVNGLNPVNLGKSLQNQLISSASTSYGGNTNWTKLTSQIQKDGLSTSNGQSYSDRLDNAVRENWQKSFNDSSSFVHSMDETTRTTFAASAGAGLRKIELGANGQLSIIGMDGEQVDFRVSEQTADAFARDQARIRAHAVQETFNEGQGLDYLTKISKQQGVSEAYSYLSDARQARTASESFGVDVATAMVKNFAESHYGDSSPESVGKAMSYFNYLSVNNPDRLNRMTEGFLNGQGYGYGGTAGAVSGALHATKNRIHDDAILRGVVGHSASMAGQRTSGISSNTLAPPDSHGLGLIEPDSTETLRKVDSLHNVNRREESGQGNVRTSASGMVAEGLETTFKGAVDGQGSQPTSEGYFDSNEIVNPNATSHKQEPIPQNAKSTLH